MFKKINEFNEKNTAIYFFIIMAILIGLLFFNNISNKKKRNECIIPTDVVSNSKKYAYDVKISKGDEIVLLSIKKYNNKYFIDKTEKGHLYTYYVNYINVYEKGIDDYYVPFTEENLISGIDNNLLFFDYLNEISISSTHEVVSDDVCYKVDDLNINMCVEGTNTISLTKDDIKITYEITSNDVEDFNVEIFNEENPKKVDEIKPSIATPSTITPQQ